MKCWNGEGAMSEEEERYEQQSLVAFYCETSMLRVRLEL